MTGGTYLFNLGYDVEAGVVGAEHAGVFAVACATVCRRKTSTAAIKYATGCCDVFLLTLHLIVTRDDSVNDSILLYMDWSHSIYQTSEVLYIDLNLSV